MKYLAREQTFNPFLPKVEIRRVTLERSENNSNAATIDFAIKRSVNSKTPFPTEGAKIKIHLIKNDQSMFMDVAKGNRSLTDLNNRVSVFSSIENIGPSQPERIEKNSIGKQIKILPFSKTILLGGGDITDLGMIIYFCVTPSQVYSVYGPLSNFLVIRGGKVISSNLVMSNSIWHQVATPKVQDFRVFKEIEALSFDFSITNNDIFSELQKDLRGDRININNPTSYFSDMFMSRDKDNNCRFFFSIDWEKILIENSLFGRLFKKHPDDIGGLLEKSNIESLKISRIRIDGSSEAGSQPRLKVFDKRYPEDLLAITKDESTNIAGQPPLKMVSDDKSIISERTNIGSLETQNLRHFNGIDKDISQRNDGYYQYKVELEILDKSVFYINTKLKSLLGSIKTLKGYYLEATKLKRNVGASPTYGPYVNNPEGKSMSVGIQK